MEAGENNKTLCQKCGEIHQTLRLSLRKRAKKCFSRSKKKLQEGNILTLLIRDLENNAWRGKCHERIKKLCTFT